MNHKKDCPFRDPDQHTEITERQRDRAEVTTRFKVQLLLGWRGGNTDNYN